VANPLRSEAEAFRFLILTIGVAAAVVLASVLGGPWAGTVIAVVLIGAVIWLYVRGPRRSA
jgi:Flp pilus assembly protein TadB